MLSVRMSEFMTERSDNLLKRFFLCEDQVDDIVGSTILKQETHCVSETVK